LLDIGMGRIAEQEQVVVNYTLERLAEVPGVTIYGPEAKDRGGVTSFNLNGVHPHDVAQILDGDGIAVRAGHHCAMPLHDKLGIPASTRASYYLYNSVEDVDKLIDSLYRVKKIFRI
jgi:cysteine desulfurase/selenocysteine lyase